MPNVAFDTWLVDATDWTQRSWIRHCERRSGTAADRGCGRSLGSPIGHGKEQALNTIWKATAVLLLITPTLSLASLSALNCNGGESVTVSRWLALDRTGPLLPNVYRNEQYGFQMSYPANFEIAAVPNELAAAGAVVTFVPGYDPSIDGRGAKTNLISFSVTIGVTHAPAAPSGSAPHRQHSARQSLQWCNARRIPFTRNHASEGAVGNRYETLSYRTSRGGRRYEIVLFVHSANPGNYSPGGIAIFDRARVTRLFETMVSTFDLAR